MIVTDKPRRGYRTLRLPLPKSDYDRFVSDEVFARETLDRLYHETPELFPTTFEGGYVLNGLTPLSIKQGYRCRRIQLKADGVTFSVAPVFVMPYMTALTDNIEKTLFLGILHLSVYTFRKVGGHLLE